MEENNENTKNETTETVNEVKNAVKNTDIKQASKEAKGFISSFFKDPIESLKTVTSDSGSKFFKIAIVVLVIWLVAILLLNILGIASRSLFSTYGSFSLFFKNLFGNVFDIIKELVAPVITIAILSGLVYAFKKNKAKSFLPIVNSILIAKIPVVIATVLELLTIISSSFSRITSTFSGYCNILSIVLLFFAFKNLSDEDKKGSYFWRFALIMGIFYIIKFVFSYLGIYL